MIGKVLAALDAAGLRENTCVIYTSDHGDHIGERGLWWKQSFYEEAAGVPLVFRWPGRLNGGQRRSQVVNLTDVTATIVDLAGAAPLHGGDGSSLVPLLSDAATPWLDQTFSEYVSDGVAAWTGGRTVVSRMLRSGRYKYVYHNGQPDQLFDLIDDADETRDRASDPDFGALRQQLRSRLLADWNPNDVLRRVQQNSADQSVLADWARAVDPPEIIRWNLAAGDNWLGWSD